MPPVLPQEDSQFGHCYPEIKRLRGTLVKSDGRLWHKAIVNGACERLSQWRDVLNNWSFHYFKGKSRSDLLLFHPLCLTDSLETVSVTGFVIPWYSFSSLYLNLSDHSGLEWSSATWLICCLQHPAQPQTNKCTGLSAKNKCFCRREKIGRLAVQRGKWSTHYFIAAIFVPFSEVNRVWTAESSESSLLIKQ